MSAFQAPAPSLHSIVPPAPLLLPFLQMSSTVVEARSLSSLTALAANPPSYPRNPTHVKHEPLVLYIARVPGSKGRRVAVGHDKFVFDTM